MATAAPCALISRAIAEDLAQYLHTLPREAWHRPSACDAWEVGDVVGHLIWVARMYTEGITHGLRGETAPLEGFPPAGALDTAAYSAFTAQQAIAQRGSLGDQVLTAFTTWTAQLHDCLMRLQPSEDATLCYHPFRLMPAQMFPPLWLNEVTLHAWDIRAALDPTASLAVESLPLLMERLPRRAMVNFRPGARLAVPVRYRFAVTGVVPGAYDLLVQGDQAVMEPASTTAAHVTCHCQTETFVLLMMDRLSLAVAIEHGDSRVEGDRGLVAAFDTWFKGV
jgi:uncharacterized protein (TIGR03083 family)